MNNKNMAMQIRDPFFDNLRFFLIFLVVLCHGIETVREYSELIVLIHETILCFVMYLFVFVTGFFSKGMADKQSDKRMRILNLILLYVVCQLAKMYILNKNSFIAPQYANWYLVVIIVWYYILPSINQFKPRFIMTCAFVAGILIGLEANADKIFQFRRMVIFFPFFMMGFYCNKKHVEFLKSHKARIIEAIALIVTVVFSVAVWSDIAPVHLFHASRSYTDMKFSPVEGCIMRVIQYILSIVMSFGILAIIPRKQMFFTKYGTRTLAIYIFHTLIYAYIKQTAFFDMVGMMNGTFVILFGFSAIVTFLLGIKPLSDILDKFMSIKFKCLLKSTN